jgi:hypothetical protein
MEEKVDPPNYPWPHGGNFSSFDHASYQLFPKLIYILDSGGDTKYIKKYAHLATP